MDILKSYNDHMFKTSPLYNNINIDDSYIYTNMAKELYYIFNVEKENNKMKKQSNMKCYPSDIDKDCSITRKIKTYPTSIDNTVEIENCIEVNKIDQYSGKTTVSTGTGLGYYLNGEFESNEYPIYSTIDPMNAYTAGMDMITSAVCAIKTDIELNKIYEMNYRLLVLYLTKSINSIYVYCNRLGSDDTDSDMHGRYILTISGYNVLDTGEKECKIDYEVITTTNYSTHPSSILDAIIKYTTAQGLQDIVSIDIESFERNIRLLNSNDLNLDMINKNDIVSSALHSIDSYSK